MAGSKSKQKGKRFEREVAQLLTEYLGVGDWNRTPHSGAMFGRSNRVRMNSHSSASVKAMTGDITAPDGYSLIVECKNYGDLSGGFHSILAGSSRQLDEWLNEVYYDSAYGEVPYALFFKITGTAKTFMAIPTGKFPVDKIKSDEFITYLKYETELKGSKGVDKVAVFVLDMSYLGLECIRDLFVGAITEAEEL